MKNHIALFVVGLLVVGGGAFFGGMKYGQAKGTSSQTALAQGFQGRRGGGGGMFAFGGGGANGGNRGGASGDVISKDDKSFTVQMRDGSGSKIVFYSTSTRAVKAADIPIDSITVGQAITVNGQANSDGSITAQVIQVRPATSTNP